MTSKRIIRIIAAALCALMLFGLFGCGAEEPTGGTIDKTDHSAPKEIKSKDISDFWVTFCLAGEWTPGEQNLQYSFEVKKDEKGNYTASESTVGLREPADKKLLKSLQKLIDKYKLVEKNGVYKITQGLPAECKECSMSVIYESGETLRFTINNDPAAKWAEDMYLVFANWFSENGDDSLVPPDRESE